MKRVAVFGNAGGGKSTLSNRLGAITGLPVYALDQLKYRRGGGEVPDDEYRAAHDRLLRENRWIIDGFGSMDTLWERLEMADTLIYIDLPVLLHVWWATKRFLMGFQVPPTNWPENSPLLRGTINSYLAVWLCHTKLTPRYREYVHTARNRKSVHHLRSPDQVEAFCRSIEGNLSRQPL
ncbi:MAG: adenylate kinase [Cyanobium sp. CACIAM 14]|nr:MAG: adenylate kinase [Cyanobium sp. CACIAM 14]